MSLVTRCAHCGTTFRVTSQQLQAHQGQVRCGSCMGVFDGLKALVSLPEAAAPGPQSAADPAAFVLEPVDPAPAAAPAVAPPAPEAAPDLRQNEPAPQQLPLDEEWTHEPRQPVSRWWAAATALLALVLGAQAAYAYRSELAVRLPGLKPHLVQLCATLRCTVAPPQRPRQISIEASDLQVENPARPGVIQLTATLRNLAGHDLGYPALDLVLTNTREHAVARRIFLPRDYLGAGRDMNAGIPASAEITIRLDLDTGDLNPAGFRLDLMAAPLP